MTANSNMAQPTLALSDYGTVRCRVLCECGHRLPAHDIEILPDGNMRAVCPRCHHVAFTVELVSLPTGWDKLNTTVQPAGQLLLPL
jgi:hypothetical protein